MLEAVDEREVDLAGAQERHADVGLRLDQRQLDVGVEVARNLAIAVGTNDASALPKAARRRCPARRPRMASS